MCGWQTMSLWELLLQSAQRSMGRGCAQAWLVLGAGEACAHPPARWRDLTAVSSLALQAQLEVLRFLLPFLHNRSRKDLLRATIFRAGTPWTDCLFLTLLEGQNH